MRFVSVISMLCLAAVLWVMVPTNTQGQGEGILVTATAYTCDNHPNNPMYPCGPLRWGGDKWGPGMACPVSWKNQYYVVPGFGTLRCDDTGAYDYYYGRPHIDIRVSTYEYAYAFGVQRMTIYPANGSSSSSSSGSASSAQSVAAPTQTATPVPPTATPIPPTPTPAPLDDSQMALARAQEIAPFGDSDTAIVRLVTLRTINKHLPFLSEELDVALDQLVWIVTLWQPESKIPDEAKALPDSNEPVAAQLFVLNPKNGDVLAQPYVTYDVLFTLGWLPSDQESYRPN